MTEPGTGWPFWAPSDNELVERALDLADLRAGERFLDLGCGDGSVLVAAAKRGAVVLGVDSDEELVAQANKNLAEAGADGEAIVGDVFEIALDVDVLFTYLSPATLQRLVPRFCGDEAAGTRLVTVDYTLTGVEQDASDEEQRVHLYRLPLSPLPAADSCGWHAAGLLVAAVPEHESLTVLELAHPGGRVAASASGELVGAVDIATGLDEAGPGQPVAIDVRWAGCEAGTLLRGAIEIEGLDPLPVVALFTDDSIDHLWELSEEGAANLSSWLDAGNEPSSFHDLLDAAEG